MLSVSSIYVFVNMLALCLYSDATRTHRHVKALITTREKWLRVAASVHSTGASYISHSKINIIITASSYLLEVPEK
jgi:hypothetical protein